MPLLVRLAAIAILASFVITFVIVAREKSTEAEQSTSSTADSWADLTSQNGKPVVEYGLKAGDALVIRFSQDDLHSCILIVLTGPRTGGESTTAGFGVEFEIVSAHTARDRAEFLAGACDDAWIRVDKGG